MIVFLHPVFTISTIVLILYSFMEVYLYKRYRSAWIWVWVLIILIGLRDWIGADYPIYARSYRSFGERLSFTDVFNSVIGKEDLMMEWLYTLLGKVTYAMGFPFYIFTFIIAIISIGLKYWVFDKNVFYPVLAMLLYVNPTMYISDGGHMRQAVAMAIVLFSFKFIKERKMLMFLFTMYLAMAFHNSAVIFVMMYWLVKIRLNSNRILILVLLCMALSPLKLYQYISALDGILQSDVYEGFANYDALDVEVVSTRFVKFNDLLCIMYTYFMVAYDKEACERIPYYEYMRNIGVVGVCLYFIFRWNDIFSTRLVMNLLVYMPMVLASIVAAIKKEGLKKILHLFLVAFIVFNYFVFANLQGEKAGYTWRYKNYLWYSD